VCVGLIFKGLYTFLNEQNKIGINRPLINYETWIWNYVSSLNLNTNSNNHISAISNQGYKIWNYYINMINFNILDFKNLSQNWSMYILFRNIIYDYIESN